MLKQFSFALVNVTSKKIAVKRVKKFYSFSETHASMCTFHEVKSFILAGGLFVHIWQTKILRMTGTFYAITRKLVCNKIKNILFFSI